MVPFKILVPIGCRSDEGLSAPVIRRLKLAEWCEVKTCKLEPQNFKLSYELMENICRAVPVVGCSNPWKPDLALITGDRVEMCAAAAAAFHNKVKIAHLYAGVVNDPVTTFDDIDRHCITLWSDIQFVENVVCGYVVCELKRMYIPDQPYKPKEELAANGVHVVGITHLDDLEIDESVVPKTDITSHSDPEQKYIVNAYSLVLLNNEPLSKDQPMPYVGGNVIQIGGNPDGKSSICKGNIGWNKYYDNLPRAQFIGLLKNCQYFITNSSSAIYEAPYFLKEDQIVMIGERNKNRGKVECKPGGSDKVVEVLKEYAEKYINK